jgi:tRNA(fMet)-specific endonuclease VapC
MTPRFMLDTNLCIYIINNRPPAVRARFERLRPGQVVISAITYGELCYGAGKSVQQSKSLRLLEQFVQDVPVQALEPHVARTYGQIRTLLEQNGRVIGNHDMWIGAHALTLGLTLVTNNEREFKRIPGLRVENWAE